MLHDTVVVRGATGIPGTLYMANSVVDIEFNPEKKRRETILVSKNAQFFID